MPKDQVLPSLQGCRIALIASADNPYTPSTPLSEREANVLFYPASQTLPPDSYDELDGALLRCQRGEVDWLLLTTPCAVEAVADRMAQLEIASASLAQTRVALYGAQTQQVASMLLTGLPHPVAGSGTHGEMVGLLKRSEAGLVVLPLAQRSRSDWPQLLQLAGFETIVAPAYRLLLGRGGDDLPGLLWGGLVDAVVFFTENSVRHFAIRLKGEGGSLDMLKDVVIACQDASTATAADMYDLHVHLIPAEPTVTALAEALARHFTTAKMSA